MGGRMGLGPRMDMGSFMVRDGCSPVRVVYSRGGSP